MHRRLLLGFFPALIIAIVTFTFSSRQPINGDAQGSTRPYKLMAVGASSTAGACSTAALNQAGMRHILLSDLKGAKSYDPNVTFVGPFTTNAVGGADPEDGGYDAVGGITIYQMQNGYSHWNVPSIASALSKYTPDLIIIHGGANDMFSTGDNLSGKDAAARMQSLLDAIRTSAPNAYVVLNTTQPNYNPGTEARIEEYNSLLRTNVVLYEIQQHMKISLVDLFSALYDSSGNVITADFCNWKGTDPHLSDAGYQLWEGLLNTEIQGILPVMLSGATRVPTLTPTAPTPSGLPNLIQNGEFDNGTRNWVLLQNNGGAGTLSVTSSGGLPDKTAAQVSITGAGVDPWDIQLTQQPLTLMSGTAYTITFTARADSAKTINLALQQQNSPYATYWSQDVNLTSDAQTFSYSFTSTASDSAVALHFDVGGNTITSYFDGVSITPDGSATSTPATATDTSATPSTTP